MSRFLLRPIVLTLVFLPLSVGAGMLEEGIEPYEKCALCHGLFGDSSRDKFPKLAGQPQAYLEAQIRDFLSGARSNDGGQMAAVVTELEDNDISLVAQWFSSQANPEPAAQSDAVGEQRFISVGCAVCHVDSQSGEMPRLHAQHASYLAKQMRDFRDGARTVEADGQKLKQLAELSDSDIVSVAHYLSAQPRQNSK